MTEAPAGAWARAAPLEPGLYMVATPIGSARDITLRALDVLGSADVVAAEDTRSTRRLLEIHGVPLAGRPLVAYHDRNGPAVRPRLLADLAAGRSVAYVAEAGTPLVSDPGYPLVRAAIEAGHPVRSVPGASAALAALTVSGLPTDRFHFAGFPPPRGPRRRRFLESLRDVDATLILFEAPRRLSGLIQESVEVFGGGREAAVCRELTKLHEDVRRMKLEDLVRDVADMPLKGEAVLVIGRGAETRDDLSLEEALEEALAAMSFKEAVASVAQRLGLPRRQVYQRGLTLSGRDGGGE